MPRELEKRRNALQVNFDERDKLKRMYDESLARIAPNSAHAKVAEDMNKVPIFLFSLKMNTSNRWTKQSCWR